jgi:cyclic pyranopterin phosphate synthase
MTSTGFTHLDEHGHARMVNVTAKPATFRLARAECRVRVTTPAGEPITLDPAHFVAAQTAGIQAAKRTSLIIPLCHSLSAVAADLHIDAAATSIRIEATSTTVGQTGVEMEALTACAVAALTLIAAAKEEGHLAVMDGLTLLEKVGGKSGHWTNPAIDQA